LFDFFLFVLTHPPNTKHNNTHGASYPFSLYSIIGHWGHWVATQVLHKKNKKTHTKEPTPSLFFALFSRNANNQAKQDCFLYHCRCMTGMTNQPLHDLEELLARHPKEKQQEGAEQKRGWNRGWCNATGKC
jgi:hypothetical protein